MRVVVGAKFTDVGAQRRAGCCGTMRDGAVTAKPCNRPGADQVPGSDAREKIEMIGAGGAHHPLARKRKIEFAELANKPGVLTPAGGVAASLALECFCASGLDHPARLWSLNLRRHGTAFSQPGPF